MAVMNFISVAPQPSRPPCMIGETSPSCLVQRPEAAFHKIRPRLICCGCQPLRRHEMLQPAATRVNAIPALRRETDNDQRGGWKLAAKPLSRLDVARGYQHRRQLLKPGIVADDHQ